MAANRKSRNWLPCLWPGLPGTWREGRILSLVLALTAAAAAQLVAVVCFVWPEMLQPALRTVVCFCVGGSWLFFVVRNLAQEARRPGFGTPNAADDLFQSAQLEYLKGSWESAESRLKRLVHSYPADAEVRLLLATLYRRMRRPDASAEQLDRLDELPRAKNWKDEIQRERSYAAAMLVDGDQSISATDLEAA